jgi:hypothetical protein
MGSNLSLDITQCPSCGCTEIGFNEAGGESICTNCGRILEENNIVSSIEFSESASGSRSLPANMFFIVHSYAVCVQLCDWTVCFCNKYEALRRRARPWIFQGIARGIILPACTTMTSFW